MADAVLFILLFFAVAATVALARSALRYWWAERAGRPYELAQDRLGITLRVAAAGAAALTVFAVVVPLLSHAGGGYGIGSGGAETAAGSAAAARNVPGPGDPAAPSRAAAPPDAGHASAAPRTIAHPAGGVLQELPGGTRVWTPPQYAYPRAAKLAFPVVVAHVPADDPELYEGFVTQVQRGLADPFLLVMPRGCGTAGPDLDAVARHYRALTTRSARAILGVGDQAACVVGEAFAHPDRYRAVAAVSGAYEHVGLLSPSLAGRRPALLMASATGERTARDSAIRFRALLHPRADEVRLIDGVSGRRELLALVAGYLTEKIDGPKRP
ncbi:hypothetical protein QMK19_28505 [Streptomyces sp. H10-C2]|uniref:hypothetical protein n=1 Tax=unclassified Streptomyces TaxID=2593676 RepID=UPI0024BB3A99|nr:MULTISPECIES: hypothetical protein [unclassified Streptomyces]MDJ0344019.1 hypothetical protein [Streptomyces sp. PH10-H1]MDJ0373490.1 hypothetical protein [Streptomyces sp. H10-C2]